MSLDESLISYAVRSDKGLTELQQAGVSRDDFVDEFRTVWNYLLRTKRDHDAVPSEDTLLTRFPDLSLPRTKAREVPILLHDLRQRRKYIEFLKSLNDAATNATSYEEIDDVMQVLQGRLNALTVSGHGKNHLVDLFDPATSKRMRKEIQLRRSGKLIGIPTGLETFDRVAGGLQKQKMYTIIGRPGLGKSWLDLLFVAQAVMDGKTVMLYPLEMTLFDTAARLYTLFSQKMFGAERVLKNHAITSGKVSPKKVRRFLTACEDAFPGRLYVADMASLADPYTVERIEAEVEMHRPDMFWVDYITLLKQPQDADGWAGVRILSNGIKNIGMRRDVVAGCSAQVNREAMKNPDNSDRLFLPRLENIAYGDSIGQDADAVFSINRAKRFLYYALVKHRGGPEIGKTRCKFDVNTGMIEEYPEDES